MQCNLWADLFKFFVRFWYIGCNKYANRKAFELVHNQNFKWGKSKRKFIYGNFGYLAKLPLYISLLIKKLS